MAKISTAYVSNFSASLEATLLQNQGLPVYVNVARVSEKLPDNRNTERVSAMTPDEQLREEAGFGYTLPPDVQDQLTLERPDELDSQIIEEGGEVPSLGTNSLTSGSKPEPSGSSPQATPASHPSPAPGAENPSSADHPTSQPPSTASSTSGSGQGTGSDQAHPSGSSAELATQTPPTRASASEQDPGSGGFAVSGPVE
jgi:hypothetical protein